MINGFNVKSNCSATPPSSGSLCHKCVLLIWPKMTSQNLKWPLFPKCWTLSFNTLPRLSINVYDVGGPKQDFRGLRVFKLNNNGEFQNFIAPWFGPQAGLVEHSLVLLCSHFSQLELISCQLLPPYPYLHYYYCSIYLIWIKNK